MSRKVFQDLHSSLYRNMGKGECVDCHNFSGKYKRCFQCNKSTQKYFNEKKQKDEQRIKEERMFMISRGKECVKKGGKCGHIIC